LKAFVPRVIWKKKMVLELCGFKKLTKTAKLKAKRMNLAAVEPKPHRHMVM